MNVYCLNDSAYDELDSGYVWMAYWYEDGGYDGMGTAVALGEDGFLYAADLSHCSCYGAFEHGFEKMCSVEDFLGSLDQVHGYIDEKELENKVVELLR